MAIQKLKEFLNSQKVKYITIAHSPAFTSPEVAAASHVSGKQLAKTVMIKVNGKLAMVVVPANDKVNFSKMREVTSGAQVDLASEMEFKEKFPDCEPGTMPPFGNLYDMPVYVSNRLADQTEIAFSAGLHSELMQMAFADFTRLAKPQMVDFE